MPESIFPADTAERTSALRVQSAVPSDSQWRRDRQHFIQNYAANNGLDEKEALRSQSENHRSKLVDFVDQMCKHGGSVAGADRMSVRAVIGFAEAEWTFTDGLLPTDYDTFQEYLPDDFEALGTEGVHEEVVASILNNLMRFRGYSSADVAIDRFHQEKISLMKCVEQIGWDSVTGELEGVLRSLRKEIKHPLHISFKNCGDCVPRLAEAVRHAMLRAVQGDGPPLQPTPRRITKTEAARMANKAPATVSEYLKQHDSKCTKSARLVGPDGHLDCDTWAAHIKSQEWKARCRNRRRNGQRGENNSEDQADLEGELTEKIGELVLDRARTKKPPTTEDVVAHAGRRHQRSILEILDRDYHQDRNGCWLPEDD